MTNAEGVVFCAAYALLLAVTIFVTLRMAWWYQDRRWNRFVDRWADAAERGADMSVLNGCPDMHRL